VDKVKVVYDPTGHTLTVWLGDPTKEHLCEETADEVILMKDSEGKVIGFELLQYHPADPDLGLDVETVVLAEK